MSADKLTPIRYTRREITEAIATERRSRLRVVVDNTVPARCLHCGGTGFADDAGCEFCGATGRDEDAAKGMAWFNGLSRSERAFWLDLAGSAVPADAWAAWKAAQHAG